MAIHLETEPQPPMTTLVSGIVQDAQKLVGQQLKLFQVELKNDLRKTKEASVPLVVGMLIALVGAITLALAGGYLISWTWPDLPLWAGLAIVGGGMALVGAAFALWGKCKFDSFNALPDETAEGLRENLQWKTKN